MSSESNVTMIWRVFNKKTLTLLDEGMEQVVNGSSFKAHIKVRDLSGVVKYSFTFNNVSSYETDRSYNAMPGVLCLLPPFIAIVLVVLLREATLGLFFGVWMGSMLLVREFFWVFSLTPNRKKAYFNPVKGFLDTIAEHFVTAWTDHDNGEVVVFALFLGGWTALIRRSGGFQDLTDKLMRRMPLSSRSG